MPVDGAAGHYALCGTGCATPRPESGDGCPAWIDVDGREVAAGR